MEELITTRQIKARFRKDHLKKILQERLDTDLHEGKLRWELKKGVKLENIIDHIKLLPEVKETGSYDQAKVFRTYQFSFSEKNFVKTFDIYPYSNKMKMNTGFSHSDFTPEKFDKQLSFIIFCTSNLVKDITAIPVRLW